MRAKHSKDISINRFAYNGREFEYELERKRVECAIMIKAAQAEKDEERANEEI